MRNPKKTDGKKEVHRSIAAEEVILAYCKKHQLDKQATLEGFHQGIVALVLHLLENREQPVRIAGLGMLRWRFWKPRLGYNRYTDETISIPASWRIKFLPDQALEPLEEKGRKKRGETLGG